VLDLQGFGGQLLDGLRLTVLVAAATLPLAVSIGLAGALGLRSGQVGLARAIRLYTAIIRGVPELVILLLLYFGGTMAVQAIAESVFGYDDYLEVDALTAGILALTAVHGAYCIEVFRGALSAIPSGQAEAARALGLSGSQGFRLVVLPQLWRHALPGLGNTWLVLIKDTAIVSVVGLDDMMRRAYTAAGATRQPFTFFVAAALFYLALTLVSTFVIRRLESRARRSLA
jgi:His/Glu/Gln/Arg/opine family amino acid ABC transporter permease subunit